jgi:hypothetical protein
MGLLNASDWKAKWIQPGYSEDSILRGLPIVPAAMAVYRPNNG